MIEAAALFLAGLALFFYGISGVGAKLQQASSRRMRNLLSRATDHSGMAILIGSLFGMITQSASVVAFILSSMVSTGMIKLHRALLIVAAANIGTTVLVFLAALDLRVAVLYLIGVSGLTMNFRALPIYQNLLSLFFSVGVLFLGLDFMKSAFKSLPTYDNFSILVSFLSEWQLAPFLIGCILRTFIQSSSAIGIIAITLCHGLLINEDQAFLIVCGTGFGVGIASFFLSSTISGPPRQIVFFQGLTSSLAGLLCGLIVILYPNLIDDFFQIFPSGLEDSSARIAILFLVMMVLTFVCGVLALPVANSFLELLSPTTLEQDLSKPLYISDESLHTPEIAVDLIDREQKRLFERNIQLIDYLQSNSKLELAIPMKVILQASNSLEKGIAEYINDLLACQLAPRVAQKVLISKSRQDNLAALLETIAEFVQTRKNTEFSAHQLTTFNQLMESKHLLLTVIHDSWGSDDEFDQEILLNLTKDRGELIEKLRQPHEAVSINNELYTTSASSLFFAMTLFERTVWLLRRITNSLTPSVK